MLYIHGWIYRIAEGTYRDLGVTVDSLDGRDAMAAHILDTTRRTANA